LLERIVVGTDGSDTATSAVAQAIDLAKAMGAKLYIVSAFVPSEPAVERAEAVEIPADVQHAVGPRQGVNTILDAAAGEAEKAGVTAETLAREGDPADALLDAAEEMNADLIVVGNKGMTGARRFLLGSVPNNVSHHAPCDVYIARTT
jgi:nucleotide-binding universal stress UspA family protein